MFYSHQCGIRLRNENPFKNCACTWVSCKGSNFDWLFTEMSIHQKSGRKTSPWRRRLQSYQALFFVSRFRRNGFTKHNENRAWSQVNNTVNVWDQIACRDVTLPRTLLWAKSTLKVRSTLVNIPRKALLSSTSIRNLMTSRLCSPRLLFTNGG